MPKHFITAIGLIVSLGVIALGAFLVALPLYFQGVGTDVQTASVADTNAIYQTQVDYLTAEQENLEEINAEVSSLRSQIPAAGQLDDVFEVVGRAAEASRVTINTVTAGQPTPFIVRTDATDASEPAVSEQSPDPATTDPATDTTTSDDSGTTGSTPETPSTTGTGREQVDFIIVATGTDIAQAVAFVDALRSGPRLLSNITVRTTQTSAGTVDVQVSALTYVDSEG